MKQKKKKNSLQQTRSYFVKGLLLSLVATGVVGIWVLLAGSFGVNEGKILLTTFLFGGYSVLALCCLAIAERSYGIVAVFGILVNSLALLLGLILVWTLGNVDFGDLETVFKAYTIFQIAGVALAHASVVLLLAGKRPNNAVLSVTLLCITIVAAMLIFPILTSFDDLGDLYWRLIGVFSIIDVIGTIAAPVLARLSPTKR